MYNNTSFSINIYVCTTIETNPVYVIIYRRVLVNNKKHVLIHPRFGAYVFPTLIPHILIDMFFVYVEIFLSTQKDQDGIVMYLLLQQLNVRLTQAESVCNVLISHGMYLRKCCLSHKTLSNTITELWSDLIRY